MKSKLRISKDRKPQKTNKCKKERSFTVTDTLEKILLEATNHPLNKCKRKIHDLQSKDENFIILYEESGVEDVEDFDQVHEKNFIKN
jgi:hypothetical protein